jgi:hypothetical protein
MLNGFDTGIRMVLVKMLVLALLLFLIWRRGLFSETLAAVIPSTGTTVEK